jgi:hypothetical protein
MSRIVFSLFIIILILINISIFSQNEKSSDSMAEKSQKALLEQKKVELKGKIEILNKIHSQYKYEFEKFMSEIIVKPEKFGLYDNNDTKTNYKKGPPQVVFRLDRIVTEDRSGFPIFFTREALLEFSGEKLSKLTILVNKYRIYNKESYERKITILDPNNFDNIKSETFRDYIHRKSDFGHKDMALITKILILHNLNNGLQDIITKMDRLVGAYQFRFNRDAADQAGRIEEYLPVVK